MFYSYLYRDASLRSINCLNQVSINFHFLMETYLEQWPTRCVLAFSIMFCFIGSWCLRACSYQNTGYGDVYPSAYCGCEEKYVHTFVLNTELAKEYHLCAANVVKFAVKVWYLK
ncbi:hypothetical protein I4U23_003866 [Adineta vaga]|nr:hypothetical protein I4U23_003866 [Adineta vaga]